MIDVKDSDLGIIKSILKKNLSDYKCEVRAFGSRVTGKAKKFSDLDLAVVKKGKEIPLSVLESIKDELSASNLPFTVDIVDYNSISNKFREIIEERFESLII
jgi:uncharacterized protein